MRFALIEQNNKQFLLPESLAPDHIKRKYTFQPIYQIKNLVPQITKQQYQFSRDLQTYLKGKKLLLDEIPFPIEKIHDHYLNGFIKYSYGISTNQNGFHFCNRCGNENQLLFTSFHCARCQKECVYCRKCVKMGRISQCTPLIIWTGSETARHCASQIIWTGPETALQSTPQKSQVQIGQANTDQINNQTYKLNWNGELSPAQKRASDAVSAAITKKEDLLIWAVCGSGKTEVLFHGIQMALNQNKQICITTPRTDVVHELTPRLKKAFPDTDIISLYGGSDDRGKSAQLTISTTHQLLRYYQNFDVIIIDEVDAFPYSVDEMLKFAVQQAKKETSTTIYLSATPDEDFQRQSRQGILPTITVPARFHRHPLPVPAFLWCGNWQKRMKKQHRLPTNVTAWITTHLQQQKQAFLFVPHIETQHQVVKILKHLAPTIDGVHSEDPERKEKVQAFRDGKIPILVTTTILERGVTVPNTDVAVLGSEDAIFTESALVQIAGRVGRSPMYPAGDVIFYHYGKTNAMIAARDQIVRMNDQGKKLGLLD